MSIRDLVPRKWRGDRVAVRREDNPVMGLQNEMNRLFDDFWRGFDIGPWGSFRNFGDGMLSAYSPNVEICDRGKHIEVTAEVPGSPTRTWRSFSPMTVKASPSKVRRKPSERRRTMACSGLSEALVPSSALLRFPRKSKGTALKPASKTECSMFGFRKPIRSTASADGSPSKRRKKTGSRTGRVLVRLPLFF